MMDSRTPPVRCRFLEFELDPAAMTVRRHGELVPLPPTPFRVLAVLAARPNVVVTREELRRAVWGDRHLEFDAALNFAIRQLRRTLGDQADSPRVIATVPRVGYRFIPACEPVAPSREPAAVPQTTVRRRAIRWIAAMATLASAATLMFAVAPGRPSLALEFNPRVTISDDLAEIAWQAALRQSSAWRLVDGDQAEWILQVGVHAASAGRDSLVMVLRPGDRDRRVWSATVVLSPAERATAVASLVRDLERDVPQLAVQAGSDAKGESVTLVVER